MKLEDLERLKLQINDGVIIHKLVWERVLDSAIVDRKALYCLAEKESAAAHVKFEAKSKP